MKSTGRPLSLALAAVLIPLLPATPAARAQAPEFRALWASRFEWPLLDPVACRARIDQIMNDAAGARFNAVLFQVRGQADTLYPSPEETWSPLLGEQNPGWDPLAYAVAAAHARGLEFHAYINAHTCWQSNPASAETLPTNPNHVFYAHCNAADPLHRDWLHHNTPTSPAQFSENSYVWIAPGVPAYQAHFRRQVLYVVQNYAVDGVHFDRIRTPWSNQPSYDPISLARFSDPQSNPGNLSFTAWTADQITRMVGDTYAAIQSVRPGVKVSAAVYSDPNTAPTAQHQEALRWLQTGALDMAVPMMYFTGGAGSTWDTRLQLWLSGRAGRHIVAGHITSQGLSSLIEQVNLTRLRGGHGNAVFSWSSFTGWSTYASGVYAQPAPVPAMDWKTAPATAVIYGYVRGPDAGPVVDAQVHLGGVSPIALSSGDGFYSFLLVPPGTYALTPTHPQYATPAPVGVSVIAGQVLRQDLAFAGAVPPLIAEVTPDPDTAVVGTEYIRTLTLTQGTATSWTLLSGPSGAAVDVTGRVSGWTPNPAQAGHVFAFGVRANGPAGFDDEYWSVQVVERPPCDRVRFADFEGVAPGTRLLFNLPRFSGSTSGDLLPSPNVAEVSAAAGGTSGTQSYLVQWQFVDTDPQRWMRLTTSNAPGRPNPTVLLDRPVRVRLQVTGGRLRLAMGIRETGTTAEIGENGGTSGPIEWVGAVTDIDGAPQGVLVEPQPGVWQTFVFDPLTDPIRGFTGDGVLFTATGRGVFEHLAFSVVDGAGPFTVYIDDVDALCPRPSFGDIDGDGELTAADLPLLTACLAGPDVPVAPPCDAADADGDGDADLADFQVLQRVYR